MTMLSTMSNISRSKGDPKVIETGPSSIGTVDTLGKALGWFSIGLGVAELLGARSISRALGMDGNEALIRTYGIREIGSGIMSLSTERKVGLWSRVAGDGLDIATLMTATGPNNPKRDNANLALAMVIGITLLDIVAAGSVTARHTRLGEGKRRSYRNRSGFPRGVQASRGAAKDFIVPSDMRAAPRLAGASQSGAVQEKDRGPRNMPRRPGTDRPEQEPLGGARQEGGPQTH